MESQTKDDLYAVFFHSDKNLMEMKREKITFSSGDDGKVSVDFPTEDINEEGNVVIENKPYLGTVVFSGGISAVRSFLKIAKEMVDLKDEDVVRKLQDLGMKRKVSGGKRGSSHRLKNIIASEVDGSPTKRKDSQKPASPAKRKVESQTSTTKKRAKSRSVCHSTQPGCIKINEMLAFANVPAHEVNTDDSQITPLKENALSLPKQPMIVGTPEKASSETQMAVTPQKEAKTLKKGTKTQEKSPQKISKTPEKRARTLVAKTPEKSLRTKTPKKATKTPERSKTPKKVTEMPNSRARTPKKRTNIAAQDLEEIIVQSPPHHAHDQLTNQTKPQALGSALYEGLSSIYNPLNSVPGSSYYGYNDELHMHAHGSEAYSLTDLDHSTVKTSSHGGQHSNLSDDYYQMQDTGSNVNDNGTDDDENADQLGNAEDFTSVTEYYRQLSHSNKNAVVGTLERLLSALKSSGSGSTPMSTPATSITPVRRVDKRMVPLINDPNDQTRYQEVLVNPAELRTAESKAASSKRPPSYLLNKVLEMIFTKEELSNSKGSSGLNSTKMEALKDYMHVRTKTLGFTPLSATAFHTIIQNKIGNARVQLKNKQ